MPRVPRSLDAPFALKIIYLIERRHRTDAPGISPLRLAALPLRYNSSARLTLSLHPPPPTSSYGSFSSFSSSSPSSSCSSSAASIWSFFLSRYASKHRESVAQVCLSLFSLTHSSYLPRFLASRFFHFFTFAEAEPASNVVQAPVAFHCLRARRIYSLASLEPIHQ